MGMVRAIFAHPSGRIGGAIVLVYVVIALFGAFGLTPHDPLMQYRIDRLHGPSPSYWMGTDLFGRDVASRLMKGVGQSFTVAFFSVAAAALSGTVLGLTAAWYGKRWDTVMMRLMDVLLAFPAILLALLVVTIIGPGTWTSVVAISIVYTPIFTRVVRGPALSLKTRDFVDAARTFGSSRFYILTRHLLLNLVAPLAVQVTLALAWALLTEAGLSFLGLGVQPPTASWGTMVAEGRDFVGTGAWWLFIIPGFAIFLTVFSANLTSRWAQELLGVTPR